MSDDTPDPAHVGRLREVFETVAGDAPVGDGWSTIEDRVAHGGAAGPPAALAAASWDRGPRARLLAAAAVLVVIGAAVAVAVATRGDDGTDATELATGPSDEDPVRGGTLRYGLASLAAGGLCLPEAQPAGPDLVAVRAVYDTLTVPATDGSYVPYLAEEITPDATHTTWDIRLREGITFHDGSPLDATVVKNNLDAYRGTYALRTPLRSTFELQPITDVAAVDRHTVRVSLSEPWVAFPAALHSGGRLGILAQSQLDDTDSCTTDLVGTGPFRAEGFERGERLDLVRNETYWQDAPDGKPLPYLDRVELRAIAGEDDRRAALADGSIDALTTDSPTTIGELRAETPDELRLVVDSPTGEVTHLLLDASTAPFDDPRMREAVAAGIDRHDLNARINGEEATVAGGLFPAGSIGHVEEPTLPETDADRSRDLVAAYAADGGDPSFELLVPDDATGEAAGAAVREGLGAVGITVAVARQGDASLIDQAVAGSTPAVLFRNFASGDPDQARVWLTGGAAGPLNLGHVDDPTLDDLFRRGRSEADPGARAAIYQDVDRRLGEQVHAVWLWYQPWAVATAPAVHGSVAGPPLPAGDEPATALDTGHPLTELWLAR